VHLRQLHRGANDPVSPASDTVAAQDCHRYEYEVHDVHGNVTSLHQPEHQGRHHRPSGTLPGLLGVRTTPRPPARRVYYRSGAASGSFQVSGSASDSTRGSLVSPGPHSAPDGRTPVTCGVSYRGPRHPSAPGTRSVLRRTTPGACRSAHRSHGLGRRRADRRDDQLPRGGTSTEVSLTSRPEQTPVRLAFTSCSVPRLR
jgi:hypothetical protein